MEKLPKGLVYKEILQCIKEGVYFVDTNRKITFWNDYAEEITGFSASEVLDSHCYDNILNHVDDAGTHLCIEGCPLHNTIEDSIIGSVIVVKPVPKDLIINIADQLMYQSKEKGRNCISLG